MSIYGWRRACAHCIPVPTLFQCIRKCTCTCRNTSRRGPLCSDESEIHLLPREYTPCGSNKARRGIYVTKCASPGSGPADVNKFHLRLRRVSLRAAIKHHKPEL